MSTRRTAPRAPRRVTRTKAEVVEEFRTSSLREAALRVISRKGIAGATMQEVAREAGVSRPTIYLYFRDREDLLQSTADEVVGELLAEVTAVLRAEGSFEERLRRLVSTGLVFFHEHRDFFRVFLEACGGDARTRHRKAYLGELARFLAEAMRAGEARPVDPERAAVFVADALHGIIRRRLAEASSPEPAAEAEWIAATLLRGLSLEGSRS